MASPEPPPGPSPPVVRVDAAPAGCAQVFVYGLAAVFSLFALVFAPEFIGVARDPSRLEGDQNLSILLIPIYALVVLAPATIFDAAAAIAARSPVAKLVWLIGALIGFFGLIVAAQLWVTHS